MYVAWMNLPSFSWGKTQGIFCPETNVEICNLDESPCSGVEHSTPSFIPEQQVSGVQVWTQFRIWMISVVLGLPMEKLDKVSHAGHFLRKNVYHLGILLESRFLPLAWMKVWWSNLYNFWNQENSGQSGLFSVCEPVSCGISLHSLAQCHTFIIPAAHTGTFSLYRTLLTKKSELF